MWELDAVEILGLAAAAMTTGSFLPQVYRTYKTKDVEGLSLTMLSVFGFGLILWLIYGIYIDSIAVVLANLVTVLCVLLLVYFKVTYRKR